MHSDQIARFVDRFHELLREEVVNEENRVKDVRVRCDLEHAFIFVVEVEFPEGITAIGRVDRQNELHLCVSCDRQQIDPLRVEDYAKAVFRAQGAIDLLECAMVGAQAFCTVLLDLEKP